MIRKKDDVVIRFIWERRDNQIANNAIQPSLGIVNAPYFIEEKLQYPSEVRVFRPVLIFSPRVVFEVNVQEGHDVHQQTLVLATSRTHPEKPGDDGVRTT